MTSPLRIVRDTTSAAPNQGAAPRSSNETWQVALRPASFDDYIGQREIIANLRVAVRAAQHGGWQLDHVLFSGAPGLGKTSCAQVIANELGSRLVATMAPAIAHKGELASLLTSLSDGDVLFIDEIHRLSVPLQEVLYSAMEDAQIDLFTGKGPGAKAITVPLAKFTLIGATTRTGLLTGPLLDRFGMRFQLRPYELADMQTIVRRSASVLGVAIDTDGCAEIARRSRGTPRIANRLLRRVRDYAAMAAIDGALVPRSWHGGRPTNAVGFHSGFTVNGPLATEALDSLQVDSVGLDPLDRAYLKVLCDRSVPQGVESMAATLNEERGTLEDVVEPFLLQLEFIARTPRGRSATAAGIRHLGGTP